MADLSYEKLDAPAVEDMLGTVRGWSVEDGALVKRFSFGSYAAGVMFAAAVGHEADRLNHHPDLHVGFQKVTVSMVTHDVGGGLTPYDFELARRIDAIS